MLFDTFEKAGEVCSEIREKEENPIPFLSNCCRLLPNVLTRLQRLVDHVCTLKVLKLNGIGFESDNLDRVHAFINEFTSNNTSECSVTQRHIA